MLLTREVVGRGHRRGHFGYQTLSATSQAILEIAESHRDQGGIADKFPDSLLAFRVPEEVAGTRDGLELMVAGVDGGDVAALAVDRLPCVDLDFLRHREFRQCKVNTAERALIRKKW
jgi:hypothetical protein